jgi:hypothetical protein
LRLAGWARTDEAIAGLPWDNIWPKLVDFFEAILTNEEFWKGEVGDEPALSPTRDAAAINLRPAKIATQIAPGALLVDQAGRRLSGRLIVRLNITPMPSPSRHAELPSANPRR